MTDFNLVLSQVRQRLEILYQIVDELEQQGGGGGGTSDYTQLDNLPKLNSKTITGSHDGSYYGLADASSTYTKTEVNGLLDDKADKSTTYTKTEVDTALSAKADAATTYTKTETNAEIASEIVGAINDLDHTAVGGSTKYLTTISQANGIIDATAATPDTVPTTSSTKLITSGGVKTYVDNAVATKASINDIYGPGTAIPDGADLNDDTYKVPGVYYRKSTSTTEYVTNTPVASNYFKIIVEWVYPDYRLRQTFILLSRDCTYYMRVYDSGGWQAWNRFRSNEQTLLGVFGVNDATIISTNGFDCDTALTPGVYLAQNTTYAQNAVGRPDYANAGANIWRMEVKLLNSSRVYQEMVVYRIGTYEGDFDRYQRIRKTDGTWNDWQHIDTTAAGTYYPPAQQSSNSLQLTRPDAELTVEPDEDEPQEER